MLRIIITKAFSLYYYNLVLVIYQIRGEWGTWSEEVLTCHVHPRDTASSYSSLKTSSNHRSGQVQGMHFAGRGKEGTECALNFVNSYISW